MSNISMVWLEGTDKLNATCKSPHGLIDGLCKHTFARPMTPWFSVLISYIIAVGVGGCSFYTNPRTSRRTNVYVNSST